MGINESDLKFEKERLEQTISIARKQIELAKNGCEEDKSAIILAKKELHENTSHSISGLWGADGFEALAELSQYMNPVLDKIADYEALENKILLLENLVKSPYFARIDFTFEGEDIPEKIYIGRTSLTEEDSYETYVYDWRSPIASVFYRFVVGPAFYEAPSGRIGGEVHLKRQYEINNGKLEYFFDAEVQIVDDFLRKMLSQNTSSQMKTIVETIQKEQDIVIRDMENDLMMVQGVAGSGKTSIALHRAAYLMYQGLSTKLSANNILILSPNTLFEQYISNVLPELGENNVVSMVFEEMLESILCYGKIQSRNQFLESLLTSTKYGPMMKKSIVWKTSHQFLEILNRFIADLPYQWIEFEDIYSGGICVVSKEMLKDKVLRRMGTPLGIRLKQLEDFVLEAIHASKKHFRKAEKQRVKNEIQKFTELDVLELYKKLFSEKEYFYHLAEGLEFCDDMEEIFDFTRENLDTHKICYDDAIVLAYLQLKLYGIKKYKNIKQVVIDEAQDYYALQYEIFSLLFPNSKFTVLGDMNQTIEKQENLSFYEEIRRILNKKKSSLITMDKSFRCTNEILNYSMKFVEGNAEIKSFNRKGEEPRVYAAPDKASLYGKIVEEVNACKEKGYGSIGLICKTEKNAASLYEGLKGKLEIQLIQNESVSDLSGIFIIPVYLSKGLEFDAVFICDASKANYYSEDDKKIFYVACTRALHRLNLFCQGEVSPLL